MLLMVLRKMLNNRWMIVCLLIGSILAVAMVSCIPMYSEGVLQRMLTKDLQTYQEEKNVYAGRYMFDADVAGFFKEKDRYSAYTMIRDKLENEFIEEIPMEKKQYVRMAIADNAIGKTESNIAAGVNKRKKFRLGGMTDFFNKVTIIDGKVPSAEITDGVYEAVVSEAVMYSQELQIGDTYLFRDNLERKEGEFRVKIVGVVKMADETDNYWYTNLDIFDKTLIMDYDLLMRDFINIGSQSMVADATWYVAYDYNTLALEDMERTSKMLQEQAYWLKSKTNIDTRNFDVPMMQVLADYVARMSQLQTTLWVLQVPILLMLAFYLFMVSQLIIANESNEIAVLRSRGASNIQILAMYLTQSVIINAVAVAVGPLLGFWMCSVLGSANGFLDFVQRSALPVQLSFEVYLYAIIACLFSIITMLLPAVIATRVSIVERKQSNAHRKRRSSFWQRYFLDILCLAVAIYGLYSYNQRQETLIMSGIAGTDMPIDPLLFMISTLFILGAGLFLLRIYPYVVKFIFWLGRKLWSPVFYTSLVRVGRSGGQEQFLMVFLILTLSVGIFSANAAQTINRNTTDRIEYTDGADLVVESNDWIAQEIVDSSFIGGVGTFYVEPDYTPYTQIDGIEETTRVFERQGITAKFNGISGTKSINIMAIEPDTFAKVATMRETVMGYHWHHMLSFLTMSDQAVLISRAMADEYKLKVGDTYTVSWNNRADTSVMVYGIIEYWPTYNIYSSGDEEETASSPSQPPAYQNNTRYGQSRFVDTRKFFMVANLDFIQDNFGVEPYSVWMKYADGTTTSQVYSSIAEKKLNIDGQTLRNAVVDKISAKNDPMLQGTNGALTLGFIVTMAITFIGFMIYWILAIRSRSLQFGIFRAIGLSTWKIIGMLLCEQILISGVAVMMGVFIGSLTSELFVPLLKMVYSSAEQMLPFKVVFSRGDYQKIYAIVGSMMAVGFVVLGALISRIKVSQAIKLGEE